MAIGPEMERLARDRIRGLTVEVVAAFVSNNALNSADLPRIIHDVHKALIDTLSSTVAEPQAQQIPAVAIRKSVGPEALICLEDGRKFKSLKRHLATEHGLTPAEYRAKWHLPPDYPMVAPSYSATRSVLARDNGLGRKPRQARSRGKSAKKKP